MRSRTAAASRILERIYSAQHEPFEVCDLDSGICLYGAGDLGSLAIEYCTANQISIKAVFDRSPETSKLASQTKIPVRSIDSASSEDCVSTPIAICLSNSSVEEVAINLKSRGWRLPIPFYAITGVARTGHPLANGWRVGAISEKEAGEIRNICNLLADDESVGHYESFVGWHSDYSELRHQEYPIDPGSRYVISQVAEALKFQHGELVDIGSHTGSSIRRFRSAGIDFDRYVLVEPDSHSRALLDAQLPEILPRGASVRLSPNVLSAAATTVSFAEGLGYCSQIWGRNLSSTDTITLDSLEVRPDLIKIHTEGSELDILIGAQETVDKFRPIITASIYHNRLGLSRFLSYFLVRHPNYDCYLRLHGYQGTSAYMYAIPR